MWGSDGLDPPAGVVEDVCVMETWNPEKAASWKRAPKLHYCLDYDRQKAGLLVTRLEGTCSRLAARPARPRSALEGACGREAGSALEGSREHRQTGPEARCSPRPVSPPSLM